MNNSDNLKLSDLFGTKCICVSLQTKRKIVNNTKRLHSFKEETQYIYLYTRMKYELVFRAHSRGPLDHSVIIRQFIMETLVYIILVSEC